MSEDVYLPGDEVDIRIESLMHEMKIQSVSAIFRKESPPSVLREGNLITLTGFPEERSRERLEDYRIAIYSDVTLSATIPRGTVSGVYRCLRLVARTYGGRNIDFDPSTETTWRGWSFRVLGESDTKPRFAV